MTYLIPDVLNDAWGYLYHKHRSDTTYLMEVPLKVRLIEQKEKAPRTFKACTYADRIEFSSWYVERNRPRFKHLGYVLAHEVGHQMMRHDIVHQRWHDAGVVTGHLYEGSPAVTYPFIEGIAQMAWDYQINDGLNRRGMLTPEDALCDPSIGTWFDLEETIYVRLFEDQCKKQGLDPKNFRRDPATGRPEQGSSSNQPGSGVPDDRTSAGQLGRQGEGDSKGHPTTGVGSPGDGPSNPGNDAIGCGGSDVRPHDGQGDRVDELERRRNAFEKMLAEIDPEKLRGMGSGNIEKLFERLHPRPMKWFEIIQPKFRSLFGGRVPTWTTFDRAAFSRGMTLQGRVSRTAGVLALVLDTSGSVGREETALYIARLIELCTQCRPRRLVVIECDWSVHRVTEIKRPHELRRFTDPMLRGGAGLLGNAGTSMCAAHRYLIEKDIKPDLTLYFTDMGTDFPTDKGNSREVFWIATTDYKKAPIEAGRTIKMQMN